MDAIIVTPSYALQQTFHQKLLFFWRNLLQPALRGRRATRGKTHFSVAGIVPTYSNFLDSSKKVVAIATRCLHFHCGRGVKYVTLISDTDS